VACLRFLALPVRVDVSGVDEALAPPARRERDVVAVGAFTGAEIALESGEVPGWSSWTSSISIPSTTPLMLSLPTCRFDDFSDGECAAAEAGSADGGSCWAWLGGGFDDGA